MNLSEKIFLFDIDSVLVEPLGYRAALMATLERLIKPIGLELDILPDTDTIEHFEALHITSEWDMAPIILATILNSLVEIDHSYILPLDVASLAPSSQTERLEAIDYRKAAEFLSKHLTNGEYPTATALRISGRHTSPDGISHPGLFPHLAGSSMLQRLLSDSRDPSRSITTRYFQHFSLGSHVYKHVYGMPPDFETDSMLRTRDKPLLQPAIRAQLLSLFEQHRLAIAAITNRPSSPPREISESLLGYAPEAELALELNGLNEIPLIGFGRLRYVAELYGLETEALLKPSPIHILAAIFAAITGREYDAIRSAVQMTASGRDLKDRDNSIVRYFLEQLPSEIQIHVFEDTRWGIEATINAGNILSSAGIKNNIHIWGIAANPQKAKSLEQLEGKVFSEVTDAILAALD